MRFVNTKQMLEVFKRHFLANLRHTHTHHASQSREHQMVQVLFHANFNKRMSEIMNPQYSVNLINEDASLETFSW